MRAELDIDESECEHIFTLSNLFPGDNTIKAMAQDNDGLVGISTPLALLVLTGREYTGTAYKGQAQGIPGQIVAGHYDEGGNYVAYSMGREKNSKGCVWRSDEIGWSTEFAIPAGGDPCEPVWVTYQVNIREQGEYDVELLMNRPEYGLNAEPSRLEDFVQLDIDGRKIAEWGVSTKWTSGKGWRNPILPVGKQRVRLESGNRQLIVRFNRIMTPFTFFGGFKFTLVK